MKISTTITKRFFDLKMEDLKESDYFLEYKEPKPFWTKRLTPIIDHFLNKNRIKTDQNIEIVFLVGSVPHRFIVVDVWNVHRDFIPERYQSAILTDFAYAIKCVSKA